MATAIKWGVLPVLLLPVLLLPRVVSAAPAPPLPATCYPSEHNAFYQLSTRECQTEEALFCKSSLTYANQEECQNMGYTDLVSSWGEYYLYTYPVGVPELEEYAAALFLIAALWIGWRTRQRLPG